ncbi:HlyD family secretion protein [bacterium]|nr:MAG: HlyD family secretion protein [bacterium]
MRRLAGLALVAALCVPAAAQQASTGTVGVAKVRRGTMKLLVRVQGTVRPEQVYRLKSTIEGRIETVVKKANSWSDERDPIGTLLTKEMAALVDSNSSTPTGELEDRWQRVFQAVPIACPGRCFVVKVYAQPGTPTQAGTLLAEAAGKLRLVGRVRPGDTAWVREGQLVRFWDKKDPERRQAAKIERFVRDVQGEKVVPGGTFTVLLTPDAWLAAGAEWEGLIEAEVKKDVLSVPTKALLVKDGVAFLPIRVSTGVSTYDETEIVAGVPDGAPVLVLDAAGAAGLERHAPEPEPMERFALEKGELVPKKKPKPVPAEPEDELAPAPPPVRIEPERWERRRTRQKPGAIDVFPDDRPRGGKDDRYPSDIR